MVMKQLIPIILLLMFCISCGKKQRTVKPMINLQEQIKSESDKLKNDTAVVTQKDSLSMQIK